MRCTSPVWLEAAKQAAVRGWRVFPVWWVNEQGVCACPRGAACPSSGKHPRLAGWPALATTSEDQLAKWSADFPQANLGMATGTGSEVFVLDIDPKSGGKESLAKLIRKHGGFTTLEAQTGSGGTHYFFLMPKDQDVRNSASVVAPGIDVRGSGGFVAVPPSVSSKGPYSWVNNEPIANAPEWLLAALGSKRRKKTYADLLPGQRNETLASIAGSLRNQGLGGEELESALLTVNAMGDPLDDEEVAAIAASISRYPVDEGAEYPLTEAGNADRFYATYGDIVRHSNGLGWLVWDRSGRWVRDEKRAFNLVRRLVDDMRDEAKTNVREYEQLLKWAKECESWRRQSDIFKFIKLDPRLDADAERFDANPWLLNVRNGVINLQTGALLPHSPELYLTKQAPFRFDPGAKAPTWEWFLDDVFEGNQGIIDFLQQSAGIWLTGDTSEHAVWFLYGMGRNGKNTFFDTILALLGPDYGQQAAPGLLEVRNSESHTTDIAELRGIRLLVANEVAEGRKLNDSRLKQLSGGDDLKGRFMRQDNFNFASTQKLIIAGNYKPRTNDMSIGMWDRMKLIRFKKQYLGVARDLNLKAKLRAELPGIANWALAGLKRWLESPNGLVTPPAIVDEVAAYKEEMDVLGTFLKECTAAVPGGKVAKGRLYEVYTNWAGANSEKLLSNREFTATLRERGLQEGRNSIERVWLDITAITPGRKQHGTAA